MNEKDWKAGNGKKGGERGGGGTEGEKNKYLLVSKLFLGLKGYN